MILAFDAMRSNFWECSQNNPQVYVKFMKQRKKNPQLTRTTTECKSAKWGWISRVKVLDVAERACFILRYGCFITHSRRVFILTYTSARNAVQRRQGVCTYRLRWLYNFSAASRQLFARQSLLYLWMYINLAESQIFSISFQFTSTRLWKATGRWEGEGRGGGLAWTTRCSNRCLETFTEVWNYTSTPPTRLCGVVFSYTQGQQHRTFVAYVCYMFCPSQYNFVQSIQIIFHSTHFNP